MNENFPALPNQNEVFLLGLISEIKNELSSIRNEMEYKDCED